MNKTPEELAAEYGDIPEIAISAINRDAEDLVQAAFIAGYKTAAQKYEATIRELKRAIIQSVDVMAGVKYDD